MGIRPLHRVLSAQFIDSARRAEVRQTIVDVLTAVGAHVSIDSIRRRTRMHLISRALLGRRELRRWVGSDLARSVYEDVLPTYSWNGRYWDQRALLEADLGDLDKALDYAYQALAVHDHALSRTTLAVIRMKVAAERATTMGWGAGPAYWEAVAGLRDVRDDSTNFGDSDLHPYTLFFTQTLRFASAVAGLEGYDDESERLLSEWDEWVSEATYGYFYGSARGASDLANYRSRWFKLWAVDNPE